MADEFARQHNILRKVKRDKIYEGGAGDGHRMTEKDEQRTVKTERRFRQNAKKIILEEL